MKKNFWWCGVALLAACGADPPHFLGYVEGEYVRVAPAIAGRLTELPVARGGKVPAGALLFALERSRESAALAEAVSRRDQAVARLADLSKGKRPEEIAVIRAQHAQAAAALALAEKQLVRYQELGAQGAVSKGAVDIARADAAQADARVRELEAALATAELAGRKDALKAARADVQAAEAAVAQAQWSYDQKAAHAAAAALVDDTLFRVGEWVPAGAPVVSLLPPENRLVRFFVPEAEVAALEPGATVTVTCDGCAAPVSAQISFIASQAEYTPPVIYSREARQKLVFLVEARPAAADAARLRPGQPVEVRLRP